MKRNMDLIRLILLEIEKGPYDGSWLDINIDGYTDNDISYHVILLAEAGLIEAQDNSTLDGLSWQPKRLTWQGHEFLDASRDESRWEKVKEIIQKQGGSVAFDVIKEILLQLMKSSIFG